MSRNVGYTTGYKGYWTNFDHPEAPIEIAYQMTMAQEQKLLARIYELEPEVYEKSNVLRPSIMRTTQLDTEFVRYFFDNGVEDIIHELMGDILDEKQTD
tara:strand:- start:408 stop:704 length:297 start_codon:yes stop_codon:yes gene_type:complete